MINALAPTTLEQEIRRLIAVHGKEAVAEEVKAATRRPRGRRPEKDWPLLDADCKSDARDWLSGKDPFALRSNYSIAQRFAQSHPGHNAMATMQRIQRKLAQKRKRFMLLNALTLSQLEFPHATYFRTIEELIETNDADSDIWRRLLELERDRLALYRVQHGEPAAATTWKEIEERRSEGVLGEYAGLHLDRSKQNAVAGLFGGRRQKP